MSVAPGHSFPPPSPAPLSPAPAPPGISGHGRTAGAALGVSAVLTGLMAGLFWGFDISVMPGLAASDDRTFVTAMQNINTAIENPAFGLVFAGALLAPAAAALLQFRLRRRAVVMWTVAALACYCLTLLLTMAVEVPLNEDLAAAGDPGTIRDLAAVRGDFESTWVAVNILRTLTCTAALAFLTRALVLHGRGGPSPPD
ncbi:Uncharacterized membrane protein [Parafrankia irregularis]|uniref:Uncharacterized membrane protein n=1 Tax=Parafrankia irregularis TaxID=795642 RepID=A0A0S4QEK1_9ACTN|nr:MULTISPECIES: anthrone oxygenase family protein [Parafrankia]MBE3203310.1 DUF1772 domain-containing protein [Parafrankia sp. CH37]CUU54043.1 Uncharacterized membrane protein [Parafrankia irregularis]